MSGKIDQPKKKEAAGGNSAFNKFKQMDSRNQQTNTDTEVSTTHQNTISTVLKHAGSNGRVSQISTSGVDGQIVVWDLMAAGMQGMNLRK